MHCTEACRRNINSTVFVTNEHNTTVAAITVICLCLFYNIEHPCYLSRDAYVMSHLSTVKLALKGTQHLAGHGDGYPLVALDGPVVQRAVCVRVQSAR